jgi:PAS domain S-box-containing protein
MTNDFLLAQMREANERLVFATMRAEQLAEEAELARVTAAENEERFRTLIAASSAIVWRATGDGVISFEPEVWRSFTGLIGPDQGWLDAVHPDDRQRVIDLWRTAITTSTTYVCEHRVRRSEGGFAWVIARAVPILHDGVAREWIGMMTDITERIVMERARDEFMAVLGHDLRSPLASMLLGAEALQTLTLEPPFAGIVDDICSSSKRMSALVRDLMDLARGRLGGGIPVARRSCDFARLCEGIVGEAKRAHPQRTIGITVMGDCRGNWDPARLDQLMSNLLGNAIAHGTDPIQITVVGDRDDVLFLIANRGPVIPPATLSTLFQPFSGARKAERDLSNSGGIGLGLFIVSEIVRAHQGAIAVESEAGTTSFTVRLPRTAR